jgi:hypothetical protein
MPRNVIGFSRWGMPLRALSMEPKKNVPQRLKPHFFGCLYGTAEAVPFLESCGRREGRINMSIPPRRRFPRRYPSVSIAQKNPGAQRLGSLKLRSFHLARAITLKEGHGFSRAINAA